MWNGIWNVLNKDNYVTTTFREIYTLLLTIHESRILYVCTMYSGFVCGGGGGGGGGQACWFICTQSVYQCIP